MIKEVDADRNGNSDSNEELKEAFSLIDKDGDGNYCKQANPVHCPFQLRDSMIRLENKTPDHDINEMIKGADLDGDGRISFEEFVRVMMDM
uniref:EF-hand domain-containing protein n=1 Tax=Leersia perrieri TaxID=77586 RepID=A0A0D9VY98_9ORYZ